MYSSRTTDRRGAQVLTSGAPGTCVLTCPRICAIIPVGVRVRVCDAYVRILTPLPWTFFLSLSLNRKGERKEAEVLASRNAPSRALSSSRYGA